MQLLPSESMKDWKVTFVGEMALEGEDSVCGRCRWRELYPRCPAHPGEPDEDSEFERENGKMALAIDHLDEWREMFEAPTDEDTWKDSTMILCDKFEELLWVEE